MTPNSLAYLYNRIISYIELTDVFWQVQYNRVWLYCYLRLTFLKCVFRMLFQFTEAFQCDKIAEEASPGPKIAWGNKGHLWHRNWWSGIP